MMEKTQYQIEREQVVKDGGDLKKFEEDWHARACSSYRRNVRSGNKDDINKFRSGGFSV